jgi:hypothetical protein
MTREQIAADLMTLVLRIGNELPPLDDSELPADVRAAEWAYVKGIASHAILTLRDRLLGVAPETSLSQVTEKSGPSRRRDLEQL